MPGVMDKDGFLKITSAAPDLYDAGMCKGRLTLTTGQPVVIADETAKTTVYFSPYKGNQVSIYDGSGTWNVYEFTEKSVAVPATTSTPFDVFGYISGGVLALQTVNWTNDTTRATALTTQDGVYVKSGATDYRYLGTGRTTGVSGQTENSSANRLLFNYYHRTNKLLLKSYSAPHTYNTAAFRPFNNSQANSQMTFMIGVAEDAVSFQQSSGVTWAAGNSAIAMGIGLNITNGTSVRSQYHGDAAIVILVNLGTLYPVTGYNYICSVEYSSASGTAPTFSDTYLYGSILM